jgi:hypothetical protein
LAQQPGETLIYIDELPIFLFNMLRYDPSKGEERVRRFLDWFRNDARNMTKYKNLHWLISGSLSPDTLVQRDGMADTINSLRHQSLEPYGHSAATRHVSFRLPLKSRAEAVTGSKAGKTILAGTLRKDRPL